MEMVLLTAIGVGGATVLGALIGFVFKKSSHKFNDIILSFAAGVMLAAAVIGLVLPSLEHGTGKISIVVTVLGVFCGAACVNLIDKAKIKSDLEKAKELDVDLISVNMHWGAEYNQKPNAEQKRLAQLLSDAGADVILGHHTHCIQPIEWIEGKDGNKTLCFYSLGNFTSETDETVSLVGRLASFDIILNERDGLSIDNVSLRPTVMDYRSSFNKNTVYLLEEYSDELCKGHNIVSYFKKKLSMDILHGYVDGVIDVKYLPQSYLDSIS